jgi:hypothetical protein
MNRRGLLLLLVAAAWTASGCRTPKETRPYRDPPPADVAATRLTYVDTDAFDALLESALTNQDPVIIIQTDRAKPDWDGRLNAWIAAWNRGGRVATADGAKVRMQAPFVPGVKVDGDSLREFRLLVEGVMDRIEERARERAAWWAEERTRARRVELLRPYNLRFHLGTDDTIQIILFNGRYAEYHPGFVQGIARPDPENGEEWERGFSCSQCKEAAKNPGRLTSSTRGP